MGTKRKVWSTVALALATAAGALVLGASAFAAVSPRAPTIVQPGVQVPDGEGYTDGEAGAGPTWDTYGARCKTVWARRNFKNWFGVWLWRYTQQVTFCWNGAVVTYFYRDRWGEVHNILGFSPWNYQGHIATNCQYEHCYPGRWGDWAEGAWTQGKFSACAGSVCSYHYPFVNIVVYGNGGWNWSTSG